MDLITRQYEHYQRQQKQEKKESTSKDICYGNFSNISDIGCGWSIIAFEPNNPMVSPEILNEDLVISSQGQSLWKTKKKDNIWQNTGLAQAA